VRTPTLTGDTAGYGQVVPLAQPGHDALRMLWHTQVGAVAAPFVPVFMAMRAVPEEYRQHRYLSDGEAARFLDSRHAINGRADTVSRVPQGVESTRSASEIGKRLLNLVFQHHEAFLLEVTSVWEAVESRLTAEQARIAKSAGILLDAGETDLAAELLTYYSTTELRRVLQLAESLVNGLEVRTRALHGFSTDAAPRSPPQTW
jgi:hypothetical protein